MDEFEKRTGIKINKNLIIPQEKQKTELSFDNSVYYCEQYYKTGKIPGVNLTSWVSVYNLLTGVGII